MLKNILRIRRPFMFTTAKEMLLRTSYLAQIDSLKFDHFCQQFIQKYGTEKQHEILNEVNLPDKEVILNEVKWVYKVTRDAKVGFLRGDINSESMYKIFRHLEKIKLQQKTLQKQDFQEMLDLVTQSKQFRLPVKGIPNQKLEDKNNLYKRQLLLEDVTNEQSLEKLYKLLQSMSNLNKINMMQPMQKQMTNWFYPLCKAIKDEQTRCTEEDLTGNRKHYAEYFLKLSPEKIATLCLSEITKAIANIMFNNKLDESKKFEFLEGIPESTLISNIGRWIGMQTYFEKYERKFKQTMKMYEDTFREGGNGTELYKSTGIKYMKVSERKKYLYEVKNNLTKRPSAAKESIPEQVSYYIGELLVFLLKELLKVKNQYGSIASLLQKEYKYQKKEGKLNRVSILRVNDAFMKRVLLQLQKDESLFFHLERSLPTIIEPLPWINYEIGGYYRQASSFMRFHHSREQERVIKYSDLSRVYSILNKLSQVPWRINQRILKIIEQIYNEGGEKGEIPKRFSEHISKPLIELKNEKKPKERKKIQKQIQKLRNQHSSRCSFLLKLNIAKNFGRLDRFYFPQNLDFRGRIYPIPPHLSHINDDISRGLLEFAEGKKIGKSGLKWLKIHTANLMGKDKATNADKLQFIEANLDLIKIIASDPLKHRQWLAFEDCWQALSSIFELDAALSLQNPQEFVSYLHIHQDGSCNGLQHYAAMGRDIEGAYQVNLGPTEKPGDVYTHVAQMVIKMIEEDLKDQTSDKYELAKLLQHNIKRKTIKQTVMTSVYGVTFVGAKDQIFRQLKDQNFLKDDDQIFLAANYVAQLTLKAISNLFDRAHLIKKWLKKCAKLITDTNNSVAWLTPVGLPIVQPYRTFSHLDVVKTFDRSFPVQKQQSSIPLNRSKQQSAFPPNYVHSLDSTHLMYTSQKCVEKNITFAAVHDSYWTHAATVEDMNEILRKQFIRLHSQPLLENLKESFEKRFPELQFPDIPERGGFDLEKINQSIYFFS